MLIYQLSTRPVSTVGLLMIGASIGTVSTFALFVALNIISIAFE
jgi:hypothetical protein